MHFIRELNLWLKSIRDVSSYGKHHMTFRRLFFNSNKIYFICKIKWQNVQIKLIAKPTSRITSEFILLVQSKFYWKINVGFISPLKLITEAATCGVLWKKVFLEILQNSQKNTCTRASFCMPEPGRLPLLLVNFNSKIDSKIYQ